MDKLTPTQYWLKEHQITAFWHGFGISNGLNVLPEDIEEITYKHGTPKQVMRIKAEAMQKILADYVKWLESYKENWDSNVFDEDSPQNEEEFLKDEARHDSRANILKMIELLQQ